jgi:hypothetical protein
MDGFCYPIDLTGIVGYPHDISEDVIDNIPDFHNHDDGSAHVRAFTNLLRNGVIHLFMKMS